MMMGCFTVADKDGVRRWRCGAEAVRAAMCTRKEQNGGELPLSVARVGISFQSTWGGSVDQLRPALGTSPRGGVVTRWQQATKWH
jgi:hypothetical protein